MQQPNQVTKYAQHLEACHLRKNNDLASAAQTERERTILGRAVKREWVFSLAANAWHRWVGNKFLGGWHVFICCGVSMWQVKFCPKFCLPCTRACTRTQCDLSSSLCLSPARPIRCLSLLPLSQLSHSTAPLALADLIKGQARDAKSFSLFCCSLLELEERHKISHLPISLINGIREAIGLSNSSRPCYFMTTGLQETHITHCW